MLWRQAKLLEADVRERVGVPDVAVEDEVRVPLDAVGVLERARRHLGWRRRLQNENLL